MNQFRMIAAVAITGMVAATPLAAQGKSGSHGGSMTTGHGKPVTTSGTTSTHGKPATTASGGVTTHGKSGGDHARPSSSTASATSTATTSTGTTSTTSTGTTTTTAPTALSTKISRNPNQLARITGMLPAGMTLDQATTGFRNQGQFIAALNASKNQGVSFADLQKAMTVDGMSLGQAVRKLQAAPATTTTSTTTGTTSGTSTGTTSGTSSTSGTGTTSTAPTTSSTTSAS